MVAPKYDSLLTIEGISAKMPDVTYMVKNDDQSRREFERRQAAVYRMLQDEGLADLNDGTSNETYRRRFICVTEIH